MRNDAVDLETDQESGFFFLQAVGAFEGYLEAAHWKLSQGYGMRGISGRPRPGRMEDEDSNWGRGRVKREGRRDGRETADELGRKLWLAGSGLE